MPRLSTTAAVLITAVLALLLVAYVFAGDWSGHSDREPNCSSPQALDLVKRELFNRAAVLRGTNDAGFDSVERYSVVRIPSRIIRRHGSGSDKVTCDGSISLDLPPGVDAVGGRRTLTSTVSYVLEQAADGTPHLLSLTKDTAIVAPLATISQSANRTNEPLSAAPVSSPSEQGATVVQQPVARRPGLDTPVTRPQRPVLQGEGDKPAGTRRAEPLGPAVKSRSRSSPPATVRSAPVNSTATRSAVSPQIASVRPSFNCRYARTRGEIAVCGNADLASLDGQMASQFYRALSVARPGQRAMLQRTRTRFLHYRDSCSSKACMADAYRTRMAEIAGIMAGPY